MISHIVEILSSQQRGILILGKYRLSSALGRSGYIDKVSPIAKEG